MWAVLWLFERNVFQIEVDRMPAPYGNCLLHGDDDAEKDIYADIFNVNYTRIVSINQNQLVQSY